MTWRRITAQHPRGPTAQPSHSYGCPRHRRHLTGPKTWWATTCERGSRPGVEHFRRVQEVDCPDTLTAIGSSSSTIQDLSYTKCALPSRISARQKRPHLIWPPNMSVMGVRTKPACRVTEILFRGPTCSHSSSLSSFPEASAPSGPNWGSAPFCVGASAHGNKGGQFRRKALYSNHYGSKREFRHIQIITVAKQIIPSYSLKTMACRQCYNKAQSSYQQS